MIEFCVGVGAATPGANYCCASTPVLAAQRTVLFPSRAIIPFSKNSFCDKSSNEQLALFKKHSLTAYMQTEKQKFLTLGLYSITCKVNPKKDEQKYLTKRFFCFCITP